ncbi:hypothetical protein [Paraburkholderia sp. BCC1886]|uniref:hypothetical protein n=1 Tax=Paraburkholderia sp. BCC1886 TaxID=2562670 RepID=UPI00118223BE|nr:hypothetical protein [Paraburkholderia sp. BCC1886]
MYTLVSAIGKSLTGSQQWSAIDLGDMTFLTISQSYSKVYAVLTNPFVTGEVSLDLNDILSTITDQTQTFNAYLTALANTALPTSTTIPTLESKYARYQDGVRAGYTIQPISDTASLSSPAVTATKPDLLLTKDGISYETFFESCMVSVNGFFHLLETDNETGIWVINGMKSAVQCGKNKLGIVSFEDLGALTYIPITSSMLYKQTSEQSYCNHAYLNVGQDLTDKTVMLVIGGYLHVLDTKTFRLVGSQSIMIDFNNYPLFERYVESKKFIDLSSLPLTPNPNNPEAFTVSEMLSDATIEALLTLSQSFIVLLDNTEIFTNQVPVQTAPWPNAYVSYVKPDYPLVLGYGKVSEYWSTFDAGQWSLAVEDSLKDNFLWRTVNAREQTTLSSARIPMLPQCLSPAFMLQIGCDLNTTGS